MFLKGLQTNRHGNRKLIMKKWVSHFCVVYFRWLTACVSNCYTFWCIVISWNCDVFFWAMIFKALWWMFWVLKILFFSLWNSPVTASRSLLSEGLGLGQKESRWNVMLEWPGSLCLWQGFWTRVWSFYDFEILQEIAEGPIVFLEEERCICIVLWCMHVGIANRTKNSMK